jgi:hypothetical protein
MKNQSYNGRNRQEKQEDQDFDNENEQGNSAILSAINEAGRRRDNEKQGDGREEPYEQEDEDQQEGSY